MADSRCWSKEFLSEFINEYRLHPCLWKVKSKEYSNKYMKNDAYDKLVMLCKGSFPEADRAFVTKKIQSIRGTFRKELKKVMDSTRSGSSADNVYLPTLWYYDLLLFTKDQEIPSSSLTNRETNEGTPSLEQAASDDDEDVLDEDFQPGPKNAMEGDVTRNQLQVEQEGGHREQKDFGQSEYSRKQRKRKADMSDTTLQFMRACTNAIASEQAHQKNDIEEHEATGINVGKKLQRMDPLQAIYAESLINMVLKRGLLKSLGPNTDLCDQQCNFKQYTVLHTAEPSLSSSSSYSAVANETNEPGLNLSCIGEFVNYPTD